MIAQNAAHSIVLSFTYEQGHDPGKGILFLRGAEVSANDETKAETREGCKIHFDHRTV